MANFVVPGGTAALAKDIEANGRLFSSAVVGYLMMVENKYDGHAIHSGSTPPKKVRVM